MDRRDAKAIRGPADGEREREERERAAIQGLNPSQVLALGSQASLYVPFSSEFTVVLRRLDCYLYYPDKEE